MAAAFFRKIVDVIESGISLYNEGGAAKVFVLISSSSLLAPLAYIVKLYLFNDFDFLLAFLVLLTFDMFSGVAKASGYWHGGENVLSRHLFLQKLTKKLFVAACWLVTVNFVQRFVSEPDTFGAIYAAYFGNGVLASWIIWSIASNLYVITDGKFPPLGLLKRLANVQKTGDIKDLTKTPDENEKIQLDN
jgi:hypothetical protein